MSKKQTIQNLGNQLVTVGRLIAYLQTLDKTMPIVMSSDEEGNSYGPLTDFGIGGPVWMEPDLRETSMDEGEGRQALVIYPNS